MKKEVVETTLVTPSEETRRHELWLSNLDLQFRHNVYGKLISYYPAAGPEQQGGACEGFFDPERLKQALAKALVPFYPLAGRLCLGEDGRRHVDCNGEGVQFVVIRADVTAVEFFEDYQTSPEVSEIFVPALPRPEELPCILGLFQVTLLKCGGVVLTSCFHHALVDGTGAFQFMQTWSRLARGLDTAEAVGPEAPFHDRTSLRVPAPPNVLDEDKTTVHPRLVAHSYPFPVKLIDHLKSRCTAGVSTFSAVTAHIWRCMSLARGLATGSDTCLSMPVNVRRRLRPPLPHSFFGNAAVVGVLTMARVQDIVDGSLGFVAGMVRDLVNSVDHTKARAAIGYHDTKAVAPTESSMCVLVSWLGMPVYDADFGWGVPKLVMPVVNNISGMVLLLPRGNDKESGINVLIHLEPEYLPRFEKLLYDVV